MLDKLKRNKVMKFIIEFFEKVADNNISGLSSQGAYYIMVSLVPLLILVLTILKLTPLDETFVNSLILDAVPAYFKDFVSGIIKQVFSNSKLVFSVSIIILLWSASRGIHILTEGLNRISGGSPRANFLVDILISFMYTGLLIVFIPMILVVTVFGRTIVDKVLDFFPKIDEFVSSIEVVRIASSTLVIFLVIAFMYKFMPNIKLRLKEVYKGAILATIVWQIFTYLFGVYISIAISRANVYGGLSVILFLMLWFYCSMFIVFSGSQINEMLLVNKMKRDQGIDE